MGGWGWAGGRANNHSACQLGGNSAQHSVCRSGPGRDLDHKSCFKAASKLLCRKVRRQRSGLSYGLQLLDERPAEPRLQCKLISWDEGLAAPPSGEVTTVPTDAPKGAAKWRGAAQANAERRRRRRTKSNAERWRLASGPRPDGCPTKPRKLDPAPGRFKFKYRVIIVFEGACSLAFAAAGPAYVWGLQPAHLDLLLTAGLARQTCIRRLGMAITGEVPPQALACYAAQSLPSARMVSFEAMSRRGNLLWLCKRPAGLFFPSRLKQYGGLFGDCENWGQGQLHVPLPPCTLAVVGHCGIHTSSLCIHRASVPLRAGTRGRAGAQPRRRRTAPRPELVGFGRCFRSRSGAYTRAWLSAAVPCVCLLPPLSLYRSRIAQFATWPVSVSERGARL